MYLHCYFLNGLCIKGFIRIDKSNRYNGTFRLNRRFKASSFKFVDIIWVFGSGSFWEDQIVFSLSIAKAFIQAKTCFKKGIFCISFFMTTEKGVGQACMIANTSKSP